MRCRIWPLAIVLLVGVPAGSATATADKSLSGENQGGKPPKQTPQEKQAEKPKDTSPLVPLTDQQAVDYAVTEMLGGWQIGDVELMHKFYADDVLVVSGFWEPPVQGWEKYAQAYQRQRGRMQGVELNRSNTYLKVVGNMAWVLYQWTFTGRVDGLATGYRGHTSLVFERRDGKWLITVNHTSIAEMPPAAQPPAASPPGTNPPAPAKPPTL